MVASLSCAELGTAQPQLVFIFVLPFALYLCDCQEPQPCKIHHDHVLLVWITAPLSITTVVSYRRILSVEVEAQRFNLILGMVAILMSSTFFTYVIKDSRREFRFCTSGLA